MPRRKVSPQRARLGERLRELRAARFRWGAALARRLGWQQTRVSKLELGSQLPSDEDLDAWVAATEAAPNVRAELAELLTQARIEHRVWGEDYRSGSIAASQAQIGELEARATVIREYQPSMLPSIVQTPAYAREMLMAPGGPVLVGATPDAPDAVEALIAERVKRQALLYEPGRQVQIVLGQAALSVHFGSVETLIGQLDRLVVLAGLTSVNLRVLPAAAPSPILPLGGFSIHDGETLWLETLTREMRTTDPEEIRVHTAAFEVAREAAAAGADAVTLIQRVAAELRDRSVTSPSNAGDLD
ncbi:MAG: helix-turn-helix domain-containing protein [Actinomycetota bacterium]|nr:helix-turn-helix domain-containing protein [Actinomycetota bacterium]